MSPKLNDSVGAAGAREVIGTTYDVEVDYQYQDQQLMTLTEDYDWRQQRLKTMLDCLVPMTCQFALSQSLKT